MSKDSKPLDLNLIEGDLREKFTKVLQHADSLGISDEQLDRLDAVTDLRAHFEYASRDGLFRKLKGCVAVTFISIITTVILLIVLVFTTEWPLLRHELVAITFGFDYDDLSMQQCLFGVETPLLDLARPPVDCRICQNIQKVERISNISPALFETKYAYSGRPVIVTDAMANWTAVQTFNFDFFRQIYSQSNTANPEPESTNTCQFFPYKTNFTKLSDVFEMDNDRALMRDGSEPWYIGWLVSPFNMSCSKKTFSEFVEHYSGQQKQIQSNCDAHAASILRAHYRRPYFLPGAAEGSRTDWIFMGSPGHGAHMHIDNVNNPSWQAQVSGVKKWMIEPPPECYFECVDRLEFTVYPGEIIVLDTNQWFHSTRIIGSQMSITIGSEYD